jgi:hypothetical protein
MFRRYGIGTFDIRQGAIKMQREPNTIYTLSLSYGKDSLACLGAIEKLGLPLDRIVHAEVWATDTIPADLPPMVEFKTKADKIIKERYGIEVEHVWATKKVADGGGKLSYDSVFRRECETKHGKHIYGFPCQIKQWCTSKLKQDLLTETYLRRYFLSNAQTSWGGNEPLTDSRCGKDNGATTYSKSMHSTIYGFPGNRKMGRAQWCTGLKRDTIKKEFSESPRTTGDINIVQYLGIAADEPERIERHEKKKGIMLPLVMAGWDEAYCRKWCEENDLLSPIYTTATRGGCWFCHNQGVGQLRLLRKNYPDLWALLMKWDLDSPFSFKTDGHTVHDYDERFRLEDEMLIDPEKPFRWNMLNGDLQKRLF